jgi:hypothetical protein
VEKIAAMVIGGFLALLSFTFSYQYAIDLTDTVSPKLALKARKLSIIPMVF